jgi:hypothetical protein
MKIVSLKDVGLNYDHLVKGKSLAELVKKIKIYAKILSKELWECHLIRMSDNEIEMMIEPYVHEEWTYQDFMYNLS